MEALAEWRSWRCTGNGGSNEVEHAGGHNHQSADGGNANGGRGGDANGGNSCNNRCGANSD